jgi:hypothetical protein
LYTERARAFVFGLWQQLHKIPAPNEGVIGCRRRRRRVPVPRTLVSRSVPAEPRQMRGAIGGLRYHPSGMENRDSALPSKLLTVAGNQHRNPSTATGQPAIAAMAKAWIRVVMGCSKVPARAWKAIAARQGYSVIAVCPVPTESLGLSAAQ